MCFRPIGGKKGATVAGTQVSINLSNALDAFTETGEREYCGVIAAYADDLRKESIHFARKKKKRGMPLEITHEHVELGTSFLHARSRFVWPWWAKLLQVVEPVLLASAGFISKWFDDSPVAALLAIIASAASMVGRQFYKLGHE